MTLSERMELDAQPFDQERELDNFKWACEELRRLEREEDEHTPTQSNP